ncbi:MAG: hypothetical protein JW720_08885 [Sedimentisphaerales bacterium]|nr:hypothetical protein [Sedimentisphaerales bacterium]
MPKNRTADELLKMGWSFQLACILTAAVEFDLFSVLDRRAMSVASLAGELGTDVRATGILLDALTGLELLCKQDDTYSVPAELVELLAASRPGNILPMLRHNGTCLRRWVQLGRVVRTGLPAERIAGSLDKAAETEAFIGAMNNISAPVAGEVVGRLGAMRFGHLLDVGGASGTWTIAFLRAFPEAEATIFDLPGVIPMAEKRIAGAGLSDRVALAPGDFYKDDLPGGADMAWLGAIAHQNSRQQNRELFCKVFAALKDGGYIVIRDVVMDSAHTTPVRGALFAVNMLVATSGGGTYSFDEYAEDLEGAGFAEIELVHRDEFMNSLIRARKK